ncbi:MAG: hypothetical protein ACOY90_02915 [Candidatus Zhuqueibacterota bacterium]
MNEQTIVTAIENLLSRSLSDKKIAQLISQLKRNATLASNVIFKMIKRADIQRQKKLIEILGEIGDKAVVDRLLKLIEDPSADDEVKYIASIVAQQLDASVDSAVLLNNLHDPVGLGKIVVENLLSNSEAPNFVASFLDDFRAQARDIQELTLISMREITNDPRLLNLMDPLSEIMDDELKLYIIPLIAQSNHPRAFSVLQRIIRRSQAKQVQAAAQQAIFQLGKNISDHPAIERPESIFFEAHMSSVDGDNSSLLLFAIKNADGQVICLDVLSNIKLGIKDSIGIMESEAGYYKFLENFKSEPGFLLVKIPAAIAVEKIRAAEELSYSLNQPVTTDYLAFRKILDEVTYSQEEGEKVKAQYERFYSETLKEKKALMPFTNELYSFQEISLSWFIEREIIESCLSDFFSLYFLEDIRNQGKNAEKFHSFLVKVADDVFTQEYRVVLKRRLQEFAFISFIAKNQKSARYAIAAAETLLQYQPHEHPFVLNMTLNTFLKILDDGMISDEYEDDDDFEDDKFETYNPYGEHPRESRSLSPHMPEATALPCFEKLLFLAENLPNSEFARHFDPRIKSADRERKIKHVNYLQTAFNEFVRFHVGYFDWDALRKDLEISRRHKYTDENLKLIEDTLVVEMKKNKYHKYYVDNARRIWSEAVLLSGGDLPLANRHDSWMAAVEYLACCLNSNHYTKTEIASYYQVSVPTMNKRIDILKKILDIHVYTTQGEEFAFLQNKNNYIRGNS